MKKNKQIKVLLVLGIILITGCGGGGLAGGKNFVLIEHDFPKGICENQVFKDTLESEGLNGVQTKEYGNYTKSCEDDYPDVNDCEEVNYTDEMFGLTPIDCIILFDGYDALTKKVGVADFSPKNTKLSAKVKSALFTSVE